MNRKMPLAVLVVAAVVAAGYIVWTMTHGAAPPATTPAPVVQQLPASKPTLPAPLALAPPAAPESAAAVEPAPAPKSDNSALAVADPEAFVKGLNAEQNHKLIKLLNLKLGNPITELQKYQLPADMSLAMLDRNPKLALSEGQKQRLAAIQAVFRTKMEAALGDKFAQVDELGRRMAEIDVNAKLQSDADWDSQDMRYKQFEIMGAIHDAKTVFEADYETSIRAYLTPDQASYFDGYNQRSTASAAMLKQVMDNPDLFKATQVQGVVQP